MDVYPEIAVSLGEIAPRSMVFRLTRWLVGRAYGRAAKVVALDADMASVMAAHHVNATCIRPWVSQEVLRQFKTSDSRRVPQNAPFTWLYSGNLGRAHEFETLLQAQRILESSESDARLVFQGGGPSWEPAQRRASELGLRRCEWRGYADEARLLDSLLDSHVLIVTQRPETQGLLWPSKLATVLAIPRPIVFVGPADGAVAKALRQFPHAGVFRPGDFESLASWLRAQRGLDPGAIQPLNPEAHRSRALAEWMELIGAA
jgi:hypothetical protein